MIVFASFRVYFLNIEIRSSNPTLVGTSAISCAQLEIGYGIMASIIPCLKSFITPFEKQPASYYERYADGSAAFKLSPLKSLAGSETLTSGHEIESIPHGSVNREGMKVGGDDGTLRTNWKLRPEDLIYQARVTHAKSEDSIGRKSIDSGDSKRMIIKKKTDWSIDYDRPAPGSAGREDGETWDAERRDEI